MDMDHERTFSDHDLYMTWVAQKIREGRVVGSDLYMDCVNGGYLTPSLGHSEALPNIGFSIVETNQ